MISLSLIRCGQLIFLPLIRFTVKCTLNEVSIAAPSISPSPCAACPSPSMNSAPGSNTGKYMVTPSTTSLKSMFAPCGPGTSELMHSLPAGAVPIVPKNGRSGTSTLPILLLGRSSVPTLRFLSRRQTNRRSGTGGGDHRGLVLRRERAEVGNRAAPAEVAIEVDVVDVDRPACRPARRPRCRTARSAG